MSREAAQSGGWGRGRLLAILGGAGGAVVLLLAGFGYAVYNAVDSTALSRAGEPVRALDQAVRAPSGLARRDAIAAAPMLAVDVEDSRGGTPATQLLPTITVPAATAVGPGRVPTGFPHTQLGAVGQLAAIETTVLQAMDLRYAAVVYQDWALPGGVGAQRWEMTANIQAFLLRTGQSANEPTNVLVATPVGAQVKGTDGPDWVLACVLLDVRAVIVRTARLAYGYCERMQWSGDRWRIGPGAPPAHAPSTWPDTDLSRSAGWHTWVAAGQE